MTEYTTTSLIKELEKFPENLPIETELACIFNYDSDKVLEECSGKTYENKEELFGVYAKYATELAIFEGSWKDDNISDLNNIMPKYVLGWIPSYHCHDNAILKEDIITEFFQIKHNVLHMNEYNHRMRGIVNYVTDRIFQRFMDELGLTEYIEEIISKINAQEEMCKEKNLPLFAPKDGLCHNCGKQIYNRISMNEAENEHITHCPYCSKAYND